MALISDDTDEANLMHVMFGKSRQAYEQTRAEIIERLGYDRFREIQLNVFDKTARQMAKAPMEDA